jgi:hypothetical protein
MIAGLPTTTAVVGSCLTAEKADIQRCVSRSLPAVESRGRIVSGINRNRRHQA